MRGARSSIETWQRAAGFAARAHEHQKRRDGKTPYVSHPFRVAMTVRDVFACDDPVCIAAALLHDTIEDTGTDYDEIAEGFGADVARCVAALTKNMSLPEKAREKDYDARLAAADWRARLVKLADQYDNLSDVEGLDKRSRSRAVAKAMRAIKLAETDTGVAVVQRALGLVKRKVEGVVGKKARGTRH